MVGVFSSVTSANHTICRASWHSLRICSSTIITMSRMRAVLVLGEFGDRHLQHREGGVGAVPGRHLELADLRIAQVLRRRLLRTVEELLAVDDLEHAALVGAVAEIDAVALRPHRDRAVELGRDRAGGAGLLPGQAEVADMHGMGGIAEVVDLGHALDPPAGDAGDEVGDAGVALPQVLVGVGEAHQPGEQRRIGGVGDVPDLVALTAEHAEHVGLGGIALGQELAVAHAHHLGAAALRNSLPRPGMCLR